MGLAECGVAPGISLRFTPAYRARCGVDCCLSAKVSG
jgi:hypothetical protein